MGDNGFKLSFMYTVVALLLWNLSVFPAYASKSGTVSRSKLYNCQKKAAEFTYNLGKAGKKEIFDAHVRECLAARDNNLSDDPEFIDCRPVTFNNESDEDIFIGIWHGGSDGKTEKKGWAAPQGFEDWKLPKGESRNWCIPQFFSGRIIARTGCNNGKCVAGDCCKELNGKGCEGNVCTAGNDAGSVAEFTLDGWKVPGTKDQWNTWYDPSFVDGYNFPVKIEIVTKPGTSCATLGCTSLPACPWGELVDGVCLSPYKKYELEHPDFIKQQAYYVLAAKCAQSDIRDPNDPSKVISQVCGCGDQCKPPRTKESNKLPACPSKWTVGSKVIKSAGCSPLLAKKGVYDGGGDNYPDPAAKEQVVCASPDDQAPGDNVCQYFWKDYDVEAEKYKTGIATSCPDAYTWQYDDHSGLKACPTFAIESINIIYSKRTGGAREFTGMKLAQDGSISGTVTVGGGKTLSFSAKGKNDPPGTEDIVKIKVRDGDSVTITDDCGQSGNTRKCVMNYDKNLGLIPVGTEYYNATVNGNTVRKLRAKAGADGKDADRQCYDDGSGYAWTGQTPILLGMGPATNKCKGASVKMSLVSKVGAGKYKGKITVNGATPIQIPPPPPPQIETTNFDVKSGDSVLIEDNRGVFDPRLATRKCEMIYDETLQFKDTRGGLRPKGTKFVNGKFVPNPDDGKDAQNAVPECYSSRKECSGFDINNQNNYTLVMNQAIDSKKCNFNYSLYPGQYVAGSYLIGRDEKNRKLFSTGSYTADIPITINENEILNLVIPCNVAPNESPVSFSCTMIYNTEKGLQPLDDKICADKNMSNIQWDAPDIKDRLRFSKPDKSRLGDRCK